MTLNSTLPISAQLLDVTICNVNEINRVDFVLGSSDGQLFEISIKAILTAVQRAERIDVLPHIDTGWWQSVCSIIDTGGTCGMPSFTPSARDPAYLVRPDFLSPCVVTRRDSDQCYEISIHTVLQCLYIAELKCFVPPIDSIWKSTCFPFSVRRPATLIATKA